MGNGVAENWAFQGPRAPQKGFLPLFPRAGSGLLRKPRYLGVAGKKQL